MYCAPESSHHSGFRRTGPNGITWQADIFSAGAVLSDAASWVAKGEVGRKEYFDRRMEQLENTEGFALSGYETAFHDGSERLSSVDAMHRDILTTLPPHDSMTPRVLDIIENHMLVLPKDRLQANLLYSKFEKEVQDAKAESLGERTSPDHSDSRRSLDITTLNQVLPEPETPPPSGRADRIFTPPGSAGLSTSTDRSSDPEDAFSPPRSPSTPTHIAVMSATRMFVDTGVGSPTLKRPDWHLSRPLSTPNPPLFAKRLSHVSGNALRSISETRPVLSMQEAADYRKAKKMGGHINPRVERVIQELVSNLEKRDHLFLIDDTDSMKAHSGQIVDDFQTLAYIAKGIDPDYLELSFVSKPLPIIKDKDTGPLVRRLVQHLNKYVSVKGRIEDSLSTLVTEKIIKRLPVSIPLVGHVPRPKPITVFVFTDGKWGHGVRIGNGLDTPISNLMREMKSRGLNRTHVMFQFLRFGDDEEGEKHLAYLDNFGRKEKWSVLVTSSS